MAKFLFIHSNFPAQFRRQLEVLGSQSHHQVVFITENERPEWVIPGVRKLVYKPSRTAHPQTHHYVRSFEDAVLHGQAVLRVALQLKSEGFIPDLIFGHPGWGSTLFIKDVFPNSPLLSYLEWFYNALGADSDFDPSEPLTLDDLPRLRSKNSTLLVDLCSCDWGLTPTQWQKSQFPPEFQPKISVNHDGVETDYFIPKPGSRLNLPELDLSHTDELVTYVARGMEPYRGFPQFIESIPYLLERRPHCHVVIVGDDRVCYGRPLPKGQTYKQLMLEKVPLDLSRVHFTGSLAYGQYLKVLQASSVHVYLTRPFVLSWSMLEAMSTGCLVLGSATPPVQEVIRDGYNGLLVDFFAPQAIAERVNEVLSHPTRMQALRDQARQTILDRYDLKNLLPQHLWILEGVMKGYLSKHK